MSGHAAVRPPTTFFWRAWLLIGCLAGLGAPAGWFLLGAWLRSELQVEEPGSNDYSDYVFLRDAAPWSGAVLGPLAGLAVASFVVAVAVFASRCARSVEAR